jgi:hypothetical protein
MKSLKGEFTLTGWDHLDDDSSEIQRNLKPGDVLDLIIDKDNEYDKYAIRVFFKGTQVGWWNARDYKKLIVFGFIEAGCEIHTEITDTFPMVAKYSIDFKPGDEIPKEDYDNAVKKAKEYINLKQQLTEANKKASMMSKQKSSGCLIFFILGILGLLPFLV